VWADDCGGPSSDGPGGGGSDSPEGGGREADDGTTASDGSDEPRGEESKDDRVNASDIWSGSNNEEGGSNNEQGGSNNEEGGSGKGIKRALERRIAL
jgi:hypothetical protein